MTFTVMETEETDQLGNQVIMYGLCEQGGELFKSISLEQKIVKQMADTLNYEVAPQHQRDVLEDMIQQLYIP